MKNWKVKWSSWLVLMVGSVTIGQAQERCIDYVNPYIGTFPSSSVLDDIKRNESLSSGNTSVGARTPWGLASASPRNEFDPAKWESYGVFSNSESGYTHGSLYMYGFSHLNLNGIGCSDWGTVLTMPTTGFLFSNVHMNRTKYSQEEASPGYYKAYMDYFYLLAEVTATERATIMRMTYDKAIQANFIVDLYHSLLRSRDAKITKITNTTMEGWVYNGGICGVFTNRQKTHFVIEISKDARVRGIMKGKEVMELTGKRNFSRVGATGTELSGYWQYDVLEGEEVLVKTGISFVSIENARENLEQEIPEWDFDGVRKAAEDKWEAELSKIKVEGGTKDEKIMFYSGLYHSLFHPNISNDVNGEYLTIEHQQLAKLQGKQKNRYTVFSLWDTFRSVHPLLTLVYPDRQLDMVRTMVDHAKEHGELTFWELSSNEEYVMDGDPANQVILDTYRKGLTDFDVETALDAMVRRSSAEPEGKKRLMLSQYLENGYMPFEAYHGAASASLEYYYADWCVAQLAKDLGNEKVHKEYMKRAANYPIMFDEELKLVRPKYGNGEWLAGFNPDTMYQTPTFFPDGGPGFVEANSWQYSFFVPHDVPGLIELMGGEKIFVDKLWSIFDVDVRFALYNQPVMSYPYYFNFVKGEEWRSQARVRYAMEKYFTPNADGIPGNDDAGTLSAWYVWSAMGVYPDCAGNPVYQLASPVFDKITIKLDERYYPGKEFVIETTGNSDKNLYIQNMKLNGKSYDQYHLTHEDIIKGGTLSIKLSDKPKK